MVSIRSVALGCAFAIATAAYPVKECDRVKTKSTYGTLTAETITTIDPRTASCDGSTDYPDECATAEVGAPAISNSFQKYGIESPGEQAALIALMLFETGGFKYKIHHFGAVNPGQGTRNMQGPDMNQKYAASLFDTATVAQAQAQGPEAVLALANSNDDASFGSAAWYLTNWPTCTEELRKGLAAGTAEGWDAYLVNCVGTTHDPERDPLWTAAMQALGVGQ